MPAILAKNVNPPYCNGPNSSRMSPLACLDALRWARVRPILCGTNIARNRKSSSPSKRAGEAHTDSAFLGFKNQSMNLSSAKCAGLLPILVPKYFPEGIDRAHLTSYARLALQWFFRKCISSLVFTRTASRQGELTQESHRQASGCYQSAIQEGSTGVTRCKNKLSLSSSLLP
jgi:hypothetical protein